MELFLAATEGGTDGLLFGSFPACFRELDAAA
jgi:hypothetical protein